ncbi:uncharacterized protein [Dermacentor albipictus]
MDGSPSHGAEPTAEPLAEARTADEGAKPREGKRHKSRSGRSQKHKSKQATARRTSDGASPRRSHLWTGDHRMALSSTSGTMQATTCDDRRQSGMDMTTEAQSALIEGRMADQTVHDEEGGTRGHRSKHRRHSRQRGPSLTDNMERGPRTETRQALRCPPHPFSEIVASLKATTHEQAGRKAVAGDDQSLKYCVAVSLFVLVCLYYVGFLAAYTLLSGQPPHRPAASGRTIELSHTQWVFRPRSSREPARRTALATTDARGATQEGAEERPTVLPALSGLTVITEAPPHLLTCMRRRPPLPATLLLLLLSLAHEVACNSVGAPASACKEMEPRHNFKPQNQHHDYQVTVVRANRDFTVTLASLNKSWPFKGFIMRSFRVKGNKTIFLEGVFEASSLYHHVPCGESFNRSVITHNNPAVKTLVTANWKPAKLTEPLIEVFFR